MNEREKVAKELAQKDGAGWDNLSEVMVNAYLHNADLVIQERNPIPVESDTGKPVYTCDRCKDKAYIGDKPCRECNQMGLPVEEVHPKGKKAPTGDSDLELKSELNSESKSEMKSEKAEIPEGQYLCSKCNKPHRATSKIGKKHLQYSAA